MAKMTPARPGIPEITSGRMEDAVLVDGRCNRYALGSKPIVAVFDGDVVLDSTCFEIQHDEMTMRMVRPPVSQVRFLTA